MKKIVLMFILAAGLSVAAQAGTKACTAQMVTANICRAESNVVLYFDAPGAFWLSMANEICATQGYQATVDDGNGNQVPNPQTCNAFAQLWIRSVFINIEKNSRARTAAQAASEAVLSEPDPDVGEG